jgi:hypothetical protein
VHRRAVASGCISMHLPDDNSKPMHPFPILAEQVTKSVAGLCVVEMVGNVAGIIRVCVLKLGVTVSRNGRFWQGFRVWSCPVDCSRLRAAPSRPETDGIITAGGNQWNR